MILYPDAKAYDAWERKAAEARRMGVDVVTSDVVEVNATVEEYEHGFDIADYLIGEQQALNIDVEESEAVYLEANRLC